MKIKDTYNEYQEGDSDEFLKAQRSELLDQQIEQSLVLLDLLKEKNREIKESVEYLASFDAPSIGSGFDAWFFGGSDNPAELLQALSIRRKNK